MTGPLSTLSPLPAPVPLPQDYDRHAAELTEVRAAITALAAGRDWARASWTDLIDGLLAIGRADVPLSRLTEGHVDALRILAQAGREPVPGALYGVWASRSQRTGVDAVEAPDGTLRLSGTIKFASGAELLDRALVPVWLDADTHRLVDLAVTELAVDTSDWITAAMEVSGSHTVPLRDLAVDASTVVGEDNFYLRRPAFFPGGVGVAACWAGGAARIADLLLARLHTPVPPPMVIRLGRIRRHLVAAASTLSVAADQLDRSGCGDGAEPDADWQALSTEARAVVAEAVGEVLAEAHRLAGPAGLAFEADLSRAIHDLQLYVLQQNADADAGLLGQRSIDGR